MSDGKTNRLFPFSIQRAIAVLAIVLVGCLIRILPIGYGAPNAGYFSADEIDSVSRALVMAEGDLMPIHANKPTFYVGLVTAGIGARYVWLRATQGMSVAEYADAFFLDPFPFYAIARLIAILASCGILIAMVFFTRRYSGPLQILALLLLAFMPSSIYYGHVAKEDSLAALMTFLAFGFAMVAMNRAGESDFRVRFLFLSAFAAGLAVSTKYNAFFAPLFCGLAWLVVPEWRRRFWIAPALIATTLGAFVVGTPYALLHPVTFVRDALGSDIATQLAGRQVHINYIENTGASFLLKIIWAEWKLGLLFVLPVIAVWATKAKHLALPLVVPLTLYGCILIFAGQLDYHYVVPLTAPLLLLCAEALRHLWPAFNDTLRRAVMWSAAALFTISFGINFQVAQYTTVAYLMDDPREEAALFLTDYIAENPQLGDRPLLFATAYYYRYWPSVRIDAESYHVLLDETRAAGGGGGYFERAARIAKEHPENRVGARFLDVRSNFQITAEGNLIGPEQPFPLDWEHYRDRHDIVVIPHYTMAFADRDETELAEFRAMLEALAEEELIAEFPPINQAFRRDGVSLSVYRIRRAHE